MQKFEDKLSRNRGLNKKKRAATSRELKLKLVLSLGRSAPSGVIFTYAARGVKCFQRGNANNHTQGHSLRARPHLFKKDKPPNATIATLAARAHGKMLKAHPCLLLSMIAAGRAHVLRPLLIFFCDIAAQNAMSRKHWSNLATAHSRIGLPSKADSNFQKSAKSICF